jgi:hypothetical protein
LRKSVKTGSRDINISDLLYSHCPGACISSLTKTARTRSGWTVRLCLDLFRNPAVDIGDDLLSGHSEIPSSIVCLCRFPSTTALVVHIIHPAWNHATRMVVRLKGL